MTAVKAENNPGDMPAQTMSARSLTSGGAYDCFNKPEPARKALTLIRHYSEPARPASPTAVGNRAVP